MFISYSYLKSDINRQTYILHDSEFETTISVSLVTTSYLEHYSNIYDELYLVYMNKGLDINDFIKKLFVCEYAYSLNERGLDILNTEFFKSRIDLIKELGVYHEPRTWTISSNKI